MILPEIYQQLLSLRRGGGVMVTVICHTRIWMLNTIDNSVNTKAVTFIGGGKQENLEKPLNF
jgi:hypothetical protein